MIVQGEQKRPKFQLGRVVITANCLNELADVIGRERQEVLPEGLETARESLELLAQLSIQPLLRRHQVGDWGDTGEEDSEANAQALRDGSRLVSWYTTHGVKVLVITDGLTDVCPACWAGLGECEPEKGEWISGTHFRTDEPPRRVSTTVMLPTDY
jgi:hypothetical protein